jgi:hypothetical protein
MDWDTDEKGERAGGKPNEWCFFPRWCPNGCSLFVVLTQGGGRVSAQTQ